MRTELFMHFCIMNTSGPSCPQLNIFLNLPLVHATDRSKVAVPVLFLILCSFVTLTTGRLVFSRALCPRFCVCFSILITSIGEEGAGICASRTFVCVFVLRLYVFVLFLFLLVSRVGCSL